MQHVVYAGNYWLLSGVSIHSPDDWWLELQAGSAARPIKTELCLLGRCWTSDINNPDQYQDVPRISTVAARKLSHHHCTPPHELMVSYHRTHVTWHRAPAPALRTFVTQLVVVKPNVAPRVTLARIRHPGGPHSSAMSDNQVNDRLLR